MAVRIRSDGTVLCAAMHPALPGDTYLNDGLHYKLSAELKALVTEPHEKHQERGVWWWRGEVPWDVEVDTFYLDPAPLRHGWLRKGGDAHESVRESLDTGSQASRGLSATTPDHEQAGEE